MRRKLNLRLCFSGVVSDLQKCVKEEARAEANNCRSGLEEALLEANGEMSHLAQLVRIEEEGHKPGA